MSVNVKTEDDSDISQFHLAIDYSQNDISSLPTNSENNVIETTYPPTYPVVVPEGDTVVKLEPINDITPKEPKKHKSKHRSKDKEKKKKHKHRHKDKNDDDNPGKHKRKHKSKHKHRSKKSKSSKTQVKEEEESQLNPPSHDTINEATQDAISQVPSSQMANESDTSLNGINESLAGSMKRNYPLQDSEFPARKIQRFSPEIPDRDSSQISNTHDADITNRTEVPDSQPYTNGNGIKTEYEVPENGAIHSDGENYSQAIQPHTTDSEHSEGIAQDNDVPYNMTDEEHENNTDFESPPSNITTKRQARIRAQESLRKQHELEKSRLLQQYSDEEDEMFDKYIPDYEDDDSEQEYKDDDEEEEDDDEEIVDSEEEEYSQSSQADLVQVPNGIPVDTLDEIEKSKREIKPSLELIKNLQPKVATVPSSHSFYQEIEIPLSIKIDKTPLADIKPVKKGIVENLPDFTPQELENKDKRNNPYKGNPNYVSFFNRECESFFTTNNYFPKFRKRLVASKVGYDRMTYKLAFIGEYLNEEANKLFEQEISGTNWNVEEKERFFNGLARYSIHRIDELENLIQTKSQVEIMNYYNLLKNELNWMKKKSKRRQFKISIGGENYRQFRRIKWMKKLLRYNELPIAYEVSESLIRMEEIQAGNINKREYYVSSKLNQFNRESMKEYRKEEIEKNRLIKIDNANDLSKIYNQNNIFEECGNATPLEQSPVINFQSVILLEEMIKSITEKIILKLIEMKSRQHFVGLTPHKMKFPKEFIINPVDIINASKILKLFETPQLGYESTSNDGKAPKLSYYFQYLIKSLNLQVSKGDRFIKKNSRVWEPEISGKFLQMIPNFRMGEEFIRDPEELMQIRLAPKRQQTNFKILERFIDDLPRSMYEDQNSQEDILIEEEIIRRETDKIDEEDKRQSLEYEHMLLSMMVSYDTQRMDVRSSMYSEEEVMNLYCEDSIAIGEEDDMEVELEPRYDGKRRSEEDREEEEEEEDEEGEEDEEDYEEEDYDDEEDDDGVIDRLQPQDPIRIKYTPERRVEVERKVIDSYGAMFTSYQGEENIII